MKTFSLKEVAAAIRKNGLPQTTEYYFRDEDGVGHYTIPKDRNIIGACALGQAAINLDVDVALMTFGLSRIRINNDGWYENADVVILQMNDDVHLTFAQIANEIEKWPETKNGITFTVDES